MKLLLLLLLVTLCSCTLGSMPNRSALPLPPEEGTSLVELMEHLDDHRFETTPDRLYRPMEGYQPASLVYLYEMGKVTIEYEPSWKTSTTIVLTVGNFIRMGETEVRFGKYGDLHSAHIILSELSGWETLAHELQHAQGFIEYGNNSPRYSHTEDQDRIIAEEGVTYWYETSVYKNEDPEYHWDQRE